MQPDPLHSLRAAVQRSRAQRFALDDLQVRSTSQLERLRRERDLLRARLNRGPPNPCPHVRTLTDERRHVQYDGDGAWWRRDVAQQNLNRLGLIGRRTRPARRREIEDHIANLDAQIEQHDVKLAELRPPTRITRSGHRDPHDLGAQAAVALQRLHDLDRNIDLIERLDHVATRNLNRGVERGLGVEL